MSTGSPFSLIRKSESLLQRASRILPRIHHQGLRQRCGGSAWKMWRQQAMTTLFLSLPMNKQPSAPSFLPDNIKTVRRGPLADQWRVTWSWVKPGTSLFHTFISQAAEKHEGYILQRYVEEGRLKWRSCICSEINNISYIVIAVYASIAARWRLKFSPG